MRVCVAVLGASIDVSANAQCDLGRLSPGPVQPGAAFGWAVAAQGQRVVVGAYYGGGEDIGTGSAFIFHRQGWHWVQEALLLASDAAFGDYFGSAVAVDGNRVLVGADGVQHGRATGSVYFFVRQNGQWIEQARLDPLPSDSLHQFGYSVALSGDTALIGAFDDDHDKFQGSVFAYRFNGTSWEREAMLQANHEPDAVMGWSIALDGDRALIGTESASAKPDGGVAYLFERALDGTWSQTMRFEPPKFGFLINFGKSVALQGDLAAIGADADHAAGHSAGAVYLYQRNVEDGSWSMLTRLVASDAESYDYFGYSVALDGNRLLVGASLKDRNEMPDCGQAYLFVSNHGNQWVEASRLIDPFAASGDYMGYAVALAGDMAIAGAVNASAPCGASGTACVFAASLADCNGNGSTDLCDIVNGMSADVNADNIPDECGSPPCTADVALPHNSVVGIDDFVFVLLNWGAASGWGPADIFPPGGNGTVDINDLVAVLQSWGPCPQ